MFAAPAARLRAGMTERVGMRVGTHWRMRADDGLGHRLKLSAFVVFAILLLAPGAQLAVGALMVIAGWLVIRARLRTSAVHAFGSYRGVLYGMLGERRRRVHPYLLLLLAAIVPLASSFGVLRPGLWLWYQVPAFLLWLAMAYTAARPVAILALSDAVEVRYRTLSMRRVCRRLERDEITLTRQRSGLCIVADQSFAATFHRTSWASMVAWSDFPSGPMLDELEL